jgi:hypothetical protein
MTSKKSDQGSSSGSRPALKIGSPVRCTDDGVEGRITWANGVSVKIQWDDGEQVTWRRDSLAERPIAILDPTEEEPDAACEAPTDAEQPVPAESPGGEPSPAAPVCEEATADQMPPATEVTGSATEPAAGLAAPVSESGEGPAAPTVADETVQQPAKPKRQRKASAAHKEKKVSALDAAAKVLAEAGHAMNCQAMIAAMSAKGYWTSPGGKTPQATLYSAIAREMATQGAGSRFVKAERGKFARGNPS